MGYGCSQNDSMQARAGLLIIALSARIDDANEMDASLKEPPRETGPMRWGAASPLDGLSRNFLCEWCDGTMEVKIDAPANSARLGARRNAAWLPFKRVLRILYRLTHHAMTSMKP